MTCIGTTRSTCIGCILMGILMILACMHTADGALLVKPAPVHLVGQTSFVIDAFVKRAGLMYSFTRSTDEVVVTTAYKAATATANAVSNGFTSMKNAEADFAILPAVATTATRASVPDFMFFPMFAMAYTPVTNLPELAGIQRLVLSQVTVARIFQGLVKSWNDPMIAATNPAVALPNKPIEVVFMKEAQSFIDTFIVNMRLIDPLNFTVPSVNTFSTPPWPTANYAKWKKVLVARDVTSYVLGNPYSIGLSYLNDAKGLKSQIANLVNDFGNVVAPTYISTSIAFAERSILSQRAPNGALIKSQPLDMLRPPGPNSWPWLQISTLVVPRSFSRGDSCVARSELLKFLRWMLHSTQVTDVLATLEGVSVVSDELNQGLLIEETILGQTLCGDTAINGGTADEIQSGGAPASTAHTSIRTVMNLDYSLSKQQTYSYVNMDESEALAGTMDPVGRPDVSWIYPTTFYDLYPGVLERHLDNGLTMVHVAMFGTVPIFNLPADVQPRMQSSLPLVFDLETLALVFLGEIASWTDPRLAAHAPNLATAFSGASTTTITVVVCGVGHPADAAFTAMSNHLMQALSRTDAFRTLGFNYSLPADWRPMTARMAANGVKFEYVTGEARMEAAVMATPGAIGYMLAANNFTTIETEIQIAMPVALDAANPSVLTYLPVAAIPDNYLACAAAQTPSSSGVPVPRTNSVTGAEWKSCWPIVMFNALAIATDVRTATADRFGNTHVSSDLATLCDRQQKIVEFVRYWAFLPEVNVPLRLSGRVAISELQPWENEITRTLFELNCGGKPILWTRPVVWQLSSAVSTFGVAITLVGLILTLLTASLVVAFRRRTIIYSSNVLRQLMVLAGLSLMFCAPVLFSLTPTVTSCNLLSWLLFIGASLTFGPICGRLRRVYAAYRNKKKSIRRKPLELLHMWIWPGALFAADIVLLAIAQSGGGMLQPIATTRIENSAEHQYTLCAVPSAYLPHAAALAGLHLLALLVTSHMAFSVRHITTAYKESANLSWAVWNAVLSTVLIVPLIVLTGGLQGDSGVFLLLFLVSWIALCTLGFDFGFKLWTLLSEEIAMARERASRSSRSGMTNSGKTTGTGTGSHTSGSGTGSGTNNTLSILNMPILDGITSVSTIEQYILALERQIRLAKDTRLSQFGSHKSSGVKSEAASTGGGLRNRARGILSEDSVLADDDHAPPSSAPLTVRQLVLDTAPLVLSPAASASPARSPLSPAAARPMQMYRPVAARPPSQGVPVQSRTPLRIGLGNPARSPTGSPQSGAIGGLRAASPLGPQATAVGGSGRGATRPPPIQTIASAAH